MILMDGKMTSKQLKNKYPKSITGGTSIGPVPDWVQTEVDNLNS